MQRRVVVATMEPLRHVVADLVAASRERDELERDELERDELERDELERDFEGAVLRACSTKRAVRFDTSPRARPTTKAVADSLTAALDAGHRMVWRPVHERRRTATRFYLNIEELEDGRGRDARRRPR